MYSFANDRDGRISGKRTIRQMEVIEHTKLEKHTTQLEQELTNKSTQELYVIVITRTKRNVNREYFWDTSSGCQHFPHLSLTPSPYENILCGIQVFLKITSHFQS